MIYRIVFITILVCFIIVFTGCWDQVELNKRTYVVAIGIDKGEKLGEIVLTLQSIIPNRLPTVFRTGVKESGPAVRVVSTRRKTILEALRDYKQQTNEEPYLQENRLLIIGEDLARDGVKPIIDFFMRSPESKTRAWVVVARGKAGDVLKWQSEVKQIPADYIEDMIATRNTIAPMVVEDIHHFVLKLSNPTTSPTTSGIEIIPKNRVPPFDARIFGTAIFKKDKLMGWLDLRETRGLLWITHRFGNGVLETSLSKERTQNIALQIIRAGIKIVPKLSNGKIAFNVWISANGTLSEQSNDIKITKSIKNLENKAAAEIKQEVEAALYMCQKVYKSDVFGFGEEMERKYPERWKELQPKWNSEFSLLQVRIIAKVKIKGTGIMMDPVNMK